MGMVRRVQENLLPVNQDEIDRLSAMTDEEIDCSDIPDLTTLSLRPKPVRYENETVILDDVSAAWLRARAEIDHKTATEIIGELVRDRIAVSVLIAQG